jgi:hypothetical protein
MTPFILHPSWHVMEAGPCMVVADPAVLCCAVLCCAATCCCAAQVVQHPHIHQRLLAILGDMVSRERAGEIVDRALLRATTQVRRQAGVHC